MKTEPFNNPSIEYRLALRLLAQPQPAKKQPEPSPLFNAACVLIVGLMEGLVAWVILP